MKNHSEKHLKQTKKGVQIIRETLKRSAAFTGSLVFNFRGGELKDCEKKQRIKFDN